MIVVYYISLYFVVVLLIIVRSFVRRESWGINFVLIREREPLHRVRIVPTLGHGLTVFDAGFGHVAVCSTWELGHVAARRRRRRGGAPSTVLRRYCAVLGRCRRRRGTLCVLTRFASLPRDVLPSLARRCFR